MCTFGRKCGILEKRDEMCHLCAAPTIYLPLGITQVSEKRNQTKVHLCIVRRSVGSLETNRMSLVAEGAPHCGRDSPMTPLRGRGSFGHGILKRDCTLSEEKRCREIGRQIESDG